MEDIELPEAGPEPEELGKHFERLVVEMPGAFVEGFVVGNLRADLAHYYTFVGFAGGTEQAD